MHIDMKAKEFKAFIKGINVFSQLTAAQQPQILDLYTPGNSATLSVDGQQLHPGAAL
ncbi:hypothetical protein [Rhodanobacter sp. Root561]|uniref:hypothetical protein n=1 Tax=Rhodanobacter sp. Root561 TaxID=1736560 RepID=UPI0012FC4AE1|nr:hypothetical protein [Rhodanobacter sp. Root561]